VEIIMNILNFLGAKLNFHIQLSYLEALLFLKKKIDNQKTKKNIV